MIATSSGKIGLIDTSALFELQGKNGYQAATAISNKGSFLASSYESLDGSTHGINLWNLDYESWRKKACLFANRNLSQEEWQRFFGDEPYRETCPGTWSPK